ncbi:MAG TPA: hypothetical protein VFS20_03275, partial [Longimicrobium sp.]|nr:hypothetical protein [Longimicrobium sp.]
FAAQMAQQQPAAWRTAHSRMFDHLQESAEEQPDTLMALQPLYQAVTHGCLAGRYEEALNGVYWPRILRGPEFYAITKLGAVGADLGAITRFFDTPWSRVSESLSTSNQSFLLSQAAYCLRALGRLTEALQPIRASWRMDVDAEDWVNASVSGGNLSELELLLGNIDAAVSDAKQCISYAERTAEHHLHVTTRTRLANTLHQSGLTSDALALFAEAETIQGRVDATFPILYSLRGFQYCDALLSEIECVTWREFMKKTGSRASAEGPAAAHHEELLATVERRALQTLSWAQTNRYASLLDIALQQLTLGQIACYRAVLAKLQARGTGQIGQADVEHLASRRINAAVTSLRRAGLVTHLVRGFLSRAQLCVVSNDFRSGEQDLNEAWQISERGPMRLHMADIHLNRARLFHAVKPYPWESPHKDLISARKHIEQCGYWRRRDELEDTEAAAREW